MSIEIQPADPNFLASIVAGQGDLASSPASAFAASDASPAGFRSTMAAFQSVVAGNVSTTASVPHPADGMKKGQLVRVMDKNKEQGAGFEAAVAPASSATSLFGVKTPIASLSLPLQVTAQLSSWLSSPTRGASEPAADSSTTSLNRLTAFAGNTQISTHSNAERFAADHPSAKASMPPVPATADPKRSAETVSGNTAAVVESESQPVTPPATEVQVAIQDITTQSSAAQPSSAVAAPGNVESAAGVPVLAHVTARTASAPAALPTGRTNSSATASDVTDPGQPAAPAENVTGTQPLIQSAPGSNAPETVDGPATANIGDATLPISIAASIEGMTDPKSTANVRATAPAGTHVVAELVSPTTTGRTADAQSAAKTISPMAANFVPKAAAGASFSSAYQTGSVEKKDTSRVEPAPKGRDHNTGTADHPDTATTAPQAPKAQTSPEVPAQPSMVPAPEKNAVSVPSAPAPKFAAKQGLSDAASSALFDTGDDSSSIQLPLLVNTARLMQEMNRSEFRIGMQTPELGSIDIRTSMVAHTFSAQIFVEHSEAARTLTSELPGLYARLADQQVLSGPIQIHADGFATASGMPQDSRHQQQPEPNGPARFPGDFTPATARAGLVVEALPAGDRLDVRI